MAENWSMRQGRFRRWWSNIGKRQICNNCNGSEKDPNTDEVCKICDGTGWAQGNGDGT